VTSTTSLLNAVVIRALRRSWKVEEDSQLKEAVRNHSKDWVAVAAMVTGRTYLQCRDRWAHTLHPSNVKNAGQWKPEEDAKLTEAVKKHGKDWVAVAAMVLGRTNVQCRQRWVNHLDTSDGKNAGKWAPEEDAKLTEVVK
jgi:myb proto-oncogene protein